MKFHRMLIQQDMLHTLSRLQTAFLSGRHYWQWLLVRWIMAQKKETELSKKEDAKMSVKSETKSETQSEIKSEVKSDTKSEMKKAEDTRLINEEQKKGKKEIKITPINEGIVIDHIPAGKALLVAKILDVRNSHNLVTIGINLSSSKMNTKDCVKIEGRTIT